MHPSKKNWHFKKLLKRPPPARNPDIPHTPFLNLSVDIKEPSRGEILKTAKNLTSGKSPLKDRIAEIIKCSVAACITV